MECARLKSAWLAWQEANRDEQGRVVSQERFAERHLKSGQANFSHYMNGHQPLNLEALLMLAPAIGVRPDSISPRLMALITNAGFSQVPNAPIEHMIEEMPLPTRQTTLDFVKYQLDTAGIFQDPQKFAHYMATIDRLMKAQKPPQE